MSAGTEFHILASKRCELAVTQARLDGDKQERPVPPSDPCPEVRSCHEGGGFFLREKLHRTALVTFGRDRKDALAVQGECRLTEGHVPEERVERREPLVARARPVTAIPFEVVEEGFQEGGVKVL